MSAQKCGNKQQQRPCSESGDHQGDSLDSHNMALIALEYFSTAQRSLFDSLFFTVTLLIRLFHALSLFSLSLPYFRFRFCFCCCFLVSAAKDTLFTTTAATITDISPLASRSTRESRHRINAHRIPDSQEALPTLLPQPSSGILI